MLGFLGHTDHIITTAQGAGVPADGKKVFRNFCLEPTAPHTHMPRLWRPGPILYGGEPSEDFLAPVSHGSEHTRGCHGPDIDQEGERFSVDGLIHCRHWAHAFVAFVPSTFNQPTVETCLHNLSHPDPLSSEDGSSTFSRNGAIQ